MFINLNMVPFYLFLHHFYLMEMHNFFYPLDPKYPRIMAVNHMAVQFFFCPQFSTIGDSLWILFLKYIDIIFSENRTSNLPTTLLFNIMSNLSIYRLFLFILYNNLGCNFIKTSLIMELCIFVTHTLYFVSLFSG